VTKLVNPVLFTQRFPVSPSDLQAAGLLDPILNSDTKLFIDPLLLATSGNPTIRTDASTLLERRFGEIVGLVAASRATGDKAWRTAVQRLNLNERSETGRRKRQRARGEAEDGDEDGNPLRHGAEPNRPALGSPPCRPRR
jgi:hypothetical protein